MIEPVIDALTTVDQAGLEREERDDQLGDVAERRVEDAADLRSGIAPSRSVDEPDDPRRGPGSPTAETRNSGVPSTWRTKSRTIATSAMASVARTAIRGRRRQRSEDRDPAPARRRGRGCVIGPPSYGRRATGRVAGPARRRGMPGRGRRPASPRSPGDVPGGLATRDLRATSRRPRLGRPRRSRRRPPRRSPGGRAPPDDDDELAADRIAPPCRASASDAERARGRSPRGASSARGRPPPARSPPHAAARSRSVAATRPGASNRTVPRSSAAIRASRSRRSRPERGRNPSNDQRGPATPDATSAASTDDAPGIGHDRPALGGPRAPRAPRPGR